MARLIKDFTKFARMNSWVQCSAFNKVPISRNVKINESCYETSKFNIIILSTKPRRLQSAETQYVLITETFLFGLLSKHVIRYSSLITQHILELFT